MNIVLSSDKHYSAYLYVTVASILYSRNCDDSIVFYILDGGLTVIDKMRVSLLVNARSCSVHFVALKSHDFDACPVSMHVSSATYYRLRIPSLLASIDKVLYIDCDTIVKKSLRPLYDVDISDACAAVVEDVVSTRGNKKTYDKLCSNLGVNRYFNAGVLLLNLKKLRDDGVEGKCFAFIENERDRIVFWDQCVLNYVLKNKVLFLADVYNFQYNPRHHDMDKIYNSRKDDVVIVHFVGPLKPWDDGFLGSVKEEYVCYYPVYFRWFYRYAGYAQKSAIISRVFAQKVFWRIWMTLRLLMYTLLMNQFRGCIMVAVDIDRARKK